MKRTISLLVFAIGLVQAVVSVGQEIPPAEAVVSYERYKALRVTVDSLEQIDAIEQTGAVVLDCIHRPGPVSVAASAEQLTAIQKLTLPVQVLHDDVQALFEAQRPVGLRGSAFDNFFLDYHPYDGGEGSIVWYMNELVAQYPNLASMIEIGTTLEGRTIWGLRVTSDAVAVKPAVLYFSAEHAREWITTAVPNYVAHHLLSNYGVDSQITELVDNVEFFLIPVLNVDGYVYSWSTNRYWRKNRRDNGNGSFGVDLNRNWGEGWGGEGSSGTGSSETYRGPAPFSEPETQDLRDFILAHPNIRAQLDIHSFSQLILWPWSYTPALSPDDHVYRDVGFGMQAEIAAVHGLTYTAGPVYTTIYPAAGVSVDWTYAERDILSFSFELRPGGGGLEAFAPPASQILPNCEEILPAILLLTNADWVRLPLRYVYPDGSPPQLVEPGVSTVIEVDVIGQLGEVVPASVKLFYRFDPAAEFTEVALHPMGGDSFQAVLPPTNCTSQPEYYFSAESDLGQVLLDPLDAPATVYVGQMAELELVLVDDFENESGWTVGAPDDDATTGIWERANPSGTAAQPEDDHTPGAGELCYVTGAATGGSLGGNDIDNGKTTLFSPVYDLSGYDLPVIGYWRWYSNDQGAAPNADVFVVDITTDGVNWVNVETVGPAGEGTSGGWLRHEFRVSDYVTPTATVQLRFVASDEGAGSIVEAALDDFDISDAGCESLPGDLDGNGIVDAADFAAFPPCVLGPAGGIGPNCAVFDFDENGGVDLFDFQGFQAVVP